MSDRNRINNVEIYGDTPLYYKELENQGLEVSEDFIWRDFSIKDIEAAFSAFEQDIKNKCKSLYKDSERTKMIFKNTDLTKDTEARLFVQDNTHNFFDFTKYYYTTPTFNVFLGEPFVRDEAHEKRVEEDPKWAEFEPWKTFSKHTTLIAANYMYNDIVFATHAFYQAIKDDVDIINDTLVLKPGHEVFSSRW